MRDLSPFHAQSITFLRLHARTVSFSGYAAEPTDLSHAVVRFWHLADILFAELDVCF